MWAAQEIFRQARHADEDGDGRGEFGSFAELAGAKGVRGGSAVRPILSSGFVEVRDGCVRRRGYLYAVHLPARDGGTTREPGGPGVVDPDGAERHWIAYAWPEEEEHADRRTFRIDERGDMAATTGYAGAMAPAADARVSDGRTWKPAG